MRKNWSERATKWLKQKNQEKRSAKAYKNELNNESKWRQEWDKHNSPEIDEFTKKLLGKKLYEEY